jgi:hypothetical protein
LRSLTLAYFYVKHRCKMCNGKQLTLKWTSLQNRLVFAIGSKQEKVKRL